MIDGTNKPRLTIVLIGGALLAWRYNVSYAAIAILIGVCFGLFVIGVLKLIDLFRNK